jgi:hypothetical protein
MSSRGSTIIRVTKDRPFADAWNSTLHRGRRIAVALR